MKKNTLPANGGTTRPFRTVQTQYAVVRWTQSGPNQRDISSIVSRNNACCSSLSFSTFRGSSPRRSTGATRIVALAIAKPFPPPPRLPAAVIYSVYIIRLYSRLFSFVARDTRDEARKGGAKGRRVPLKQSRRCCRSSRRRRARSGRDARKTRR